MNEIMNIGTNEMLPEMKSKLNALQLQVQTLELCRQLGAHYAATQLVPKQYHGRPEDAAVAIQWGMEIGLQPLQALQNVAVVNGNATLWGDALIAIVKGSGKCEYISTHWDDETQTATCVTKRKGEPEESRSYSMADAKAAGLAGRQTYQQHAKRMISARARSHVLRDVYADLLKGFQIREIVEEDHKEEKDITPKSKTLEALAALSDKPKSEAKPEAKTEQKAIAAPSEEQLALFAGFMERFNSVQDIDTLNAIGKEIRDSGLPDKLKNELKAEFKVIKADLS